MGWEDDFPFQTEEICKSPSIFVGPGDSKKNNTLYSLIVWQNTDIDTELPAVQSEKKCIFSAVHFRWNTP